ncbi:MAG: BPL-N domain-containing protein [Candidatus Solibacter sp.]
MRDAKPSTSKWSAAAIASVVVIAVATSCGGHANPSLDDAKASAATAPVLLFNGAGVSRNDIAAVKAILTNNQLRYAEADSAQLNRMDQAEMRRYRLLIVAGGNFVEIGQSLTPVATANIRQAVQDGLSYLGICGGGFLAGKYDPPYNGLNLTSGVRFGFYAAEGRGIRKAAVPIAVVGAPTLDQYWEDGPEFTGWGSVVGKYPDGAPAIVEGSFGSGWIILSGVHPEAPESWRHGMTFNTPASVDKAYAGALVRAALNRISLAH